MTERHFLPWDHPPRNLYGLNEWYTVGEMRSWLVPKIREYEHELRICGVSLAKHSVDERIERLNDLWSRVLNKRKETA